MNKLQQPRALAAHTTRVRALALCAVLGGWCTWAAAEISPAGGTLGVWWGWLQNWFGMGT